MRKNGLRVVRCGLRVSVSPFTTRYLPIAAVSRLADLPTSRFADKFWEGELSGEPNLGARCGVRLSSQNFRQCRSTATQNYSLLAVRHSLFAIRYSLSFRLGRNFALPLSALQKSHPPVANCQSPFAFTIRHSLPFRLRVIKAVCHSLLAVRHSLFATRHSPFQKFSPTG